jgi:hypothetical protein
MRLEAGIPEIRVGDKLLIKPIHQLVKPLGGKRIKHTPTHGVFQIEPLLDSRRMGRIPIRDVWISGRLSVSIK